jgi:Sec-independent protein translocase protein TatA
MFEIGWTKLLIVGLVALIAIGPKGLLAVLRNVGRRIGTLRRMKAEFQSQFQEGCAGPRWRTSKGTPKTLTMLLAQ